MIGVLSSSTSSEAYSQTGHANISVIEKLLRYRATHPMPEPDSMTERLSPTRMIHRLKWMTVMVSRSDAKEVFARAFSRPPRLLFGNPVAFIFSAYYAYIYGACTPLPGLISAIIYVFLVSVPLLFGSPPFNRDGLFSYQWGPATISLSYIGLGGSAQISVLTWSDRVLLVRYHSRHRPGQDIQVLVKTS